jgi:UDP-GlcNAc:undecaprenyl-phosphate GlcNAc-1-phosphate transferase
MSLTVGFLQDVLISRKIIGIFVSSLLMLVFGIVDDCKELSVKAKFSTQIIATSLLVILGVHTEIAYIGFFNNLIITYVWVLAITNAFNHLDILDGLAAVVAVLVTLSFAIIAHLNNQGLIVIISLILAASTIGFLIFNFPPARVYMGNSGSHFLGFTMAVIALLINFAPAIERKIALLTPLLILGFPIFDTAFLILMRLKNGRVIFNKSDDHLALRLLKSGYSKKKTLWLMFLLGLLFSLAGITVSHASNYFGLLIVIFIILFSLFIIKRMSSVAVNG